MAWSTLGTPEINNWGEKEEERDFEIPVKVTNPDGSTVEKTVKIKIQRDTDGDGEPKLGKLGNKQKN